MKKLMATFAVAASILGQTPTPTTEVTNAQKAATTSINNLTNTALTAGFNQGKSSTNPPPSPGGTGNGKSVTVWFNEGGDKVTRDEMRATSKKENITGKVINRTWDGTTVKLFGARNESVSFNAVIEAPTVDLAGMSVQFDTLTGPNSAKIKNSFVASNTNIFNWVGRPIELFYTKYVEIKGVSTFGWYHGDERQIPPRFQSTSTHQWKDRPDHNKMYPDALLPLELVPTFVVKKGTNQSIWCDIYIAKYLPAGDYKGSIKFLQNNSIVKQVPVTLTVQPFTLPDKSTLTDFGVLDANEIRDRYVTGGGYINWNSDGGRLAKAINDTYIQLLKRHRIGIIGGEAECPPEPGKVCSMIENRFNGDLFSASNGYDGPGANQGVDIWSYSTYGTWSKDPNMTAQQMQNMLDSLGNWFKTVHPNVETFFYLMDEPDGGSFANLEKWSSYIRQDPGDGKRIMPGATVDFVSAMKSIPDLQVAITSAGIGNCSGCPNGDNTTYTNNMVKQFLQKSGNQLWMYNYNHPGTGTSNTEDDGIAMRTLGWVQAKMNLTHWLYWYLNPGWMGDWYANACTWGCNNLRMDQYWGETGDGNYTNGNGMLVYPGNDVVNKDDSYGILGPVASVRLKEWRRGIEDAEYIYMARQYDATKANAIVQSVMPKALWENPAPQGDVSWFQGPISWSSDPDSWENGRAQLAQIVAQGCASNPKAFCRAALAAPTMQKQFKAQIQEKTQ